MGGGVPASTPRVVTHARAPQDRLRLSTSVAGTPLRPSARLLRSLARLSALAAAVHAAEDAAAAAAPLSPLLDPAALAADVSALRAVNARLAELLATRHGGPAVAMVDRAHAPAVHATVAAMARLCRETPAL